MTTDPRAYPGMKPSARQPCPDGGSTGDRNAVVCTCIFVYLRKACGACFYISCTSGGITTVWHGCHRRAGTRCCNVDLCSAFLLCCRDRTTAVILAHTIILFQGSIWSTLDDDLVPDSIHGMQFYESVEFYSILNRVG